MPRRQEPVPKWRPISGRITPAEAETNRSTTASIGERRPIVHDRSHRGQHSESFRGWSFGKDQLSLAGPAEPINRTFVLDPNLIAATGETFKSNNFQYVRTVRPDCSRFDRHHRPGITHRNVGLFNRRSVCLPSINWRGRVHQKVDPSADTGMGRVARDRPRAFAAAETTCVKNNLSSVKSIGNPYCE